jgi:hypothetical protein
VFDAPATVLQSNCPGFAALEAPSVTVPDVSDAEMPPFRNGVAPVPGT